MKIIKNILRKFVDVISVDSLEVETDTGWEDISSINKTIKYEEYKIETISGKKLKGADNHILFDDKFNEIFIRECVPNKTYIQTKDGVELVTKVKYLNKKRSMYDLSVNSKNHRYYTNDILSHNSQISAIFIVWFICFHNDKVIAMLANKAMIAREIFSRVMESFELLPHFLKPGVRYYNKSTIELDNGSKVVASATSASAIRGMTVHCVETRSTNITVRNKKTGKVETLSIETFLKNVDMEKEKIINVSDYEVLTEDGFKEFDGIKVSYSDNNFIIRTEDDFIKCTNEHLLYSIDREKFLKASELEIGDTIKTKNGSSMIIDIRIHKENLKVADLLNVKDTSSYYTNNILSHNCLFLDEVAFISETEWEEFYKSVYPTISAVKDGKIIMVSTPNGLNHYYRLWSDAEKGRNEFKPLRVDWTMVPGRDENWKRETIANTSEEAFAQEQDLEFMGANNALIAPTYLKQIEFCRPIDSRQYEECFYIYKEHDPDGVYFLSVDVGKGVGRDYSVVSVLRYDKENNKIHQDAIYRSNNIELPVFPHIIEKIGRQYNDALIIIENNAIGEAVVQKLWDLEYENIYSHEEKDGRVRKNHLGGIYQTKKTKQVGVRTLKEMIENNALGIYSFETVEELSNFVRKGQSYEAEKGSTDDIVMTLCTFCFFTTTDWFNEYINSDLIGNIFQKKLDQIIEEDMTPILCSDGNGVISSDPSRGGFDNEGFRTI